MKKIVIAAALSAGLATSASASGILPIAGGGEAVVLGGQASVSAGIVAGAVVVGGLAIALGGGSDDSTGSTNTTN